MAKVIPGVETWINPDASPDRRSYRVSFEKFRRLAPGHQPLYSLVDTVTDLAEHASVPVINGLTDDDVAVQDSLYPAGRRGVGVLVRPSPWRLGASEADLAADGRVDARRYAGWRDTQDITHWDNVPFEELSQK